MNIVTGVYDSVTDAERAIRALLAAGYSDDNIGVVTRDSGKGAAISDDLGREYTSGATPPREMVISRSNVYDRLPDGFLDLVRRSNLPGDAPGWYDTQLDRHMILVYVDADNRMDEAARIIRDHRGTLYEHGGREVPGTAAGTIHGAGYGGEERGRKTRETRGETMPDRETREWEEVIPVTVHHEQEMQEKIRVRRHTLERPVHPNEFKSGRMSDGSYHLPLVTDDVRVDRSPIVREELVITGVVRGDERARLDEGRIKGTMETTGTTRMTTETSSSMTGATGGTTEGMTGRTEETTWEEVIPLTVTHETREEIRVERRTLETPMKPDDFKGRRTEDNAVHLPIVTEETRVVREPIVREELIISGFGTTCEEEQRRPAA